jgi:hypothetical protein
MAEELTLAHICEVEQGNRLKPKKYKHCCEVSYWLYFYLTEFHIIDVNEYVISEGVFFVELYDTVQLWFCTAWMADDFERKVHLFILGYQPVKRFGEFL